MWPALQRPGLIPPRTNQCRRPRKIVSFIMWTLDHFSDRSDDLDYKWVAGWGALMLLVHSMNLYFLFSAIIFLLYFVMVFILNTNGKLFSTNFLSLQYNDYIWYYNLTKSSLLLSAITRLGLLELECLCGHWQLLAVAFHSNSGHLPSAECKLTRR